MSLKRRIKASVESLLHWSGAGGIYARHRSESVATILMYHSVAAGDAAQWIAPGNRITSVLFEAHMEALARRRHVLSMRELAALLRDDSPLPPGSVVLTFDDGYRDNLMVAAPILAALDLPAVLYLPTAYLRNGKSQWADRLFSIMSRARGQTAELRGLTYGLEMGAGVAKSALRELSTALIPMSDQERDAHLDQWAQSISPGFSTPRLTLNWDEARELRGQYPLFTLGAHTRGHVDLSALDPAFARLEVQGCTQDILEELDYRPIDFSFPYGRTTVALCEVVKEEGYETAVGDSRACVVGRGTDPYWLPRIDGGLSRSRLSYRTSGAYPTLSRLLMGRA